MPFIVHARRACARAARVLTQYRREYIALSAGNGDHGRLGHGSPDEAHDGWSPRSSNYFHPVEGVSDLDVRAVAAGGAHSVFLVAGGHVFTCGLNADGQLGHSAGLPFSPEPMLVRLDVEVVSVAAGNGHTLCVDVDGCVWAFGKNTAGQLGTGNVDGTIPRKIGALAKEARVAQVACGAEHSLAVADDGRVYSWGSSTDGVLGHGSETWNDGWFYRTARAELAPRLVRSLEDKKVVAVAAGHMHSACIDDRGNLYTCGQGRFNQLGLSAKPSDHETTPSPVMSLRFVHEIACGGLHSLANTNAGVVSWGANQHGELGHGHHSDIKSAVPKPIKMGSRGWSKLAAGWKHSAGIANGKLFAWGFGGSMGSYADEKMSSGGQLGLGNEFDFWEPHEVSVPGEVKDVSCGFNHTLALVDTHS